MIRPELSTVIDLSSTNKMIEDLGFFFFCFIFFPLSNFPNKIKPL